MGKSSSAPKYDRSAAQQEQEWAAEQQRKYGNVSVQGPTGGYTWVTDPATGQQTVQVQEAATDAQRRALGSSMLGAWDPSSITSPYDEVRNFNVSGEDAANAYYNASTRYLTQDYEKQKERASADLIAKGVPIGSEAYNAAMQELDDSYNRSLQTAADTAVMQGQQYQTNALQNALARAGALSGASLSQLSAADALTAAQYDPLSRMVSGTGGDFGGTYDAWYSAETARKQAQAQNRSAIGSSIGTLAGGALGAYFGGAAGAKAGASIGGAAGGLF